MGMLVVNMRSVDYGKNNNKNHLIFTGYIPSFVNDRLYFFDYIGTSIDVEANMTEEQKERLSNEICKKYGYAPFDIKKAKQLLKTYFQFKIDT